MAKEIKRKNKTPEELKAELKQKAITKFLQDLEEVNVKHRMRLIPILNATRSKIEAMFDIEDIVNVEYKKAGDKESKTNGSTDSDDKGTKK